VGGATIEKSSALFACPQFIAVNTVKKVFLYAAKQKGREKHWQAFFTVRRCASF
jgi:hypothetical protein